MKMMTTKAVKPILNIYSNDINIETVVEANLLCVPVQLRLEALSFGGSSAKMLPITRSSSLS